MHTNYHAHQTPQFRVLSDQQIERVYQGTLECLQRTGINVLHPEARDLLAAAGARVDGIRVRIPPDGNVPISRPSGVDTPSPPYGKC